MDLHEASTDRRQAELDEYDAESSLIVYRRGSMGRGARGITHDSNPHVAARDPARKLDEQRDGAGPGCSGVCCRSKPRFQWGEQWNKWKGQR
jgi:hypothetical protein